MSDSKLTKVTRTCEACGRSFWVFPSQIKFSGAKFCSPICYHTGRTTPLTDRFFRYVGHKEPNGCILWTGCTNRDGYGVIGSGNRNRRMLLASRVSYELFIAPIPKGPLVCHRCDCRNCISPVHLFLGTHIDNAADMVAKGRGRKRTPGSRRYLRDLRNGLIQG